ncbi:hypothetical protein PIB30_054735 [Stylosanthes scabra]|uniref:Uncharacterized protein n=1 Tax=Stylosanthes scabra TaxID=79078 RepID=A0ABU6SKJ1_9FABA|nr:hypothetical protein [Stylosanthes scabra]
MEEISVRLINETKIPQTLKSLDGEVDIVNTRPPHTESDDEGAVDEGSSDDNESASAESISTEDDDHACHFIAAEMTRGDRGRGRGDRGRGTGRRGRPKKRTGIPLDLRELAAGTSAPTPVLVVPTPSPAEGGPTIRMIPTPESSRVHSSSDTTGTRSQRQSSA